MTQEKKFDKLKYDIAYRKEKKSQFNVDLNKSEMEELNILLNLANLNKVTFLRLAIQDLKNKLSDSKNTSQGD